MSEGALLRRIVPTGRALQPEVWRSRHRGILILLWLHVIGIPVYAHVMGFTNRHALLDGAIVTAAATIATIPGFGRRIRTLAATVGLLSSSALLVHLSGGLIEMHFHFFIMVPVVALYQDWTAFLAAIGYVLIHDGLFGAAHPGLVFNHPAALAHPWRWAGVHALFVGGMGLVCLVTWRVNEHMLAQRREAEEALREESRIVEVLRDVGIVVGSELELDRVVHQVADAGTRLTGARFGAFFSSIPEAGERHPMLATSGAADSFPIPSDSELLRPTFAGEALVRVIDVTEDPRYERVLRDGPAIRSFLAVPVKARDGTVLGGLFFGHPLAGRFRLVHERLAVGLAAQAAVAIDNARLYESEKAARAASDNARRRLAVMAEASKALAASLELTKVLQNLATVIAAGLNGTCAIDLIEGEDGGFRRVGFAAENMETAALGPPAGGEDSHPITQAVMRGESMIAEQNGATLIVPLIRRGEPLGALTLAVRWGSPDEDELAVLEEIARRAAVSIENARLYSIQRSVSETLQHSLLPEDLPDVPGIESAARYVPGGPDIEVGGDWYDLFPISDGDVAFVMGDVVGRGLPAASLMGQLRNSLRAYALEDHGPGEILRRLNDLLADRDAPSMTTLCVGVLDPIGGRLRIANAGHPPPVVVGANGVASFLELPSNIPLGALQAARYVEMQTMIEPGSTLVFYTDGLVEDRSQTLEEGMERIRRGATGAPADIEALCDHLLATGTAGRDVRDDVALLAVRLMPIEQRLSLRLPTRPGSLRTVRRAFRRLLAASSAGDEEAYEILVATGEACANAILHATGPGSSVFEVFAELNGDLLVQVRDFGRWRTTRLGDGGRGLTIMRRFMDQVDIERSDSGTRVTLRRGITARRKTPIGAGSGRS